MAEAEAVFVGQDLRLTLTGGVDLAGGSAKIRYRKPDSSTILEVTATVDTEATAICHYDFSPAELDTPGTWKWWLKLAFADTTVGIGKPYTHYLAAEGGS